MAKENLNIGSAANDGTGDTLRDGAIKLNNVINEVYNALGDGTNVQIDIATPAAGQVLRWNGSNAFVGSHYDALSSNLDVAGNQITSSDNGNVVVRPHGTGDIHLWAGSSGSALTYIDGADGKLKYSNHFDDVANLPDATTHHGMFAHAHTEGHGYFAHAGSWTQLIDTGSSIGELSDVDMTTNGGPSDGQVLKWVASANAFQAANDDSTTGGGGGTTQNLFETVNADTGTTTASAANDTLIIAGGSSISTSISGDTVTIAYTGAAGAPDQNIFETFNADSGTRTASATDDSFTFTGGTGITTSITGAAITITNDAPNVAQFVIQSVSGDSGSFTSSDVEGGISIVGGTNISTVMSGSTLTINNTAAALPTATDGQSLIHNGSGYEGVASPTISFQITANGSGAYRFAGGGVDPNTDDPTIYVYRGFTYRFDNTVGGPHPFALRLTSGGSALTEGVSGSQNGVQYWTVPMDLAPGTTYVYQCTQHPLMVGNLTVV